MDKLEKLTEKLKSQRGDLEKALNRLGESLNQEKNYFLRDSVIQRFEFSFEPAWKVMTGFNLSQGRESASPKSAIRVAAQLGILENPEVWFEYLEARNLASHTYNETEAEKVYQKAKEFLTDTQKALGLVQTKLEL